MIIEIFLAAVHSVGTAITMTAAGVYLHRRKMITTATKTGMARYTQQIAIPALFFSKIVDCPQDFSQHQCPNILDHLNDAWVLLVWPFYVLAVGLVVGKLVIHLVKPPKWQHNCVLAATAFANAMGMPITLLDVIGHNFQPPGNVNHKLDPSMFQSIYVILNPVLQWGLGGWLLSQEEDDDKKELRHESLPPTYNSAYSKDHPGYYADEERRFSRLNRYNLSGISLEDAGFNSVHGLETQVPTLRRNLYSIPSLEDAGSYTYHEPETVPDERTGLIIQTTITTTETTATVSSETDDDDELDNNDDGYGYYREQPLNDRNQSPSSSKKKSRLSKMKDSQVCKILTKIASKAMQPPAIGAMAGFVVASYAPLRGLFVDLNHRADNAPLEWIFDGILTLAGSAIPVNMCVVGVNLSIASSSSKQEQQPGNSVDTKTIVAVVAGKMLLMPLIGIITVYVLKTWFWDIPEQIQFQFYLVLMMNFITPTANVVMVIAELGSGTSAKNVMASLIGYQYVVAPFLLSLTVMMVVWMAVL